MLWLLLLLDLITFTACPIVEWGGFTLYDDFFNLTVVGASITDEYTLPILNVWMWWYSYWFAQNLLKCSHYTLVKSDRTLEEYMVTYTLFAHHLREIVFSYGVTQPSYKIMLIDTFTLV